MGPAPQPAAGPLLSPNDKPPRAAGRKDIMSIEISTAKKKAVRLILGYNPDLRVKLRERVHRETVERFVEEQFYHMLGVEACFIEYRSDRFNHIVERIARDICG